MSPLVHLKGVFDAETLGVIRQALANLPYSEHIVLTRSSEVVVENLSGHREKYIMVESPSLGHLIEIPLALAHVGVDIETRRSDNYYLQSDGILSDIREYLKEHPDHTVGYVEDVMYTGKIEIALKSPQGQIILHKSREMMRADPDGEKLLVLITPRTFHPI